MAARRKAPVVLATILTLAIAGTALASVRGTTLKMGLSNVLTGNYITSFAATVLNAPAFIIRNNSTTAASSALRVWAPYGGVPLELYAKAGNPVMKVSNAIKVVNLNADLLDSLDSTAFARSAQEGWRQIGAPGQPDFTTQAFCSATLQPWTHIAGEEAGFYKDSSGRVHLRGTLIERYGCSNVAGYIAFQLPAGYRPARTEHRIIATDPQGATELSPGLVRIDANGNVTPTARDFSANTYLDGISFRAEP